MGDRLMREVLHHAPATLTHREKLLSVALAVGADDDTRTTTGSVEAPSILRAAMVKRSGLYDVLKALVAKGVLKKATAGQRNAAAAYVFLPMTSQCPEFSDTDGQVQCPSFPDTDRSQCPGFPDTENPQCPRIPDTEPKVEGPGIPDTETSPQSPGSPDTETAPRPNHPKITQPQSPRIPDTDESRTRERYLPTTSSSLSIPMRPEIEQLCQQLADRIEANGSKRPRITDRWLDAARLLLDKDGRTVDQVAKAIDWCQADPFWRANVLSMPKLRERYDQLRLKASAEREQQRRAEAAAARTRTNPNSYAEKGIF